MSRTIILGYSTRYRGRKCGVKQLNSSAPQMQIVCLFSPGSQQLRPVWFVRWGEFSLRLYSHIYCFDSRTQLDNMSLRSDTSSDLCRPVYHSALWNNLESKWLVCQNRCGLMVGHSKWSDCWQHSGQMDCQANRNGFRNITKKRWMTDRNYTLKKNVTHTEKYWWKHSMWPW